MQRNTVIMNRGTGNVRCDVLTTEMSLRSQGDMKVIGKSTLGDVCANNMKLDGNLEIEGVIVGTRDSVPVTEEQMRREQAYQNRLCMAREQYKIPLPIHQTNGDESLYANRIANFSKGLPHNAIGEVDPAAYDQFLDALENPYLLDSLPLVGDRPLVNPLGGLSYETNGADPHSLYLAPAPTFSSAQQASEMVEDYWMALLRDVNFSDYATDATATSAIADLNAMSDFRGPKVGGVVTAQTLFRGSSIGCTLGPYLSQFFYMECPYGANRIDQKARVPVAGDDFMTDFAEWKFIQEGNSPITSQTFDSELRYLRNGRDLGEWVHVDQLDQAYLKAAIILLANECPLNPGNPYTTGHANQQGFGTLGGPEILSLMSEVSARALRAVWYQKWYVHRRARPEVFAARVDRHKAGAATYPLHADLLGSAALVATHAANGNYLLPQSFPEGSPMHPSYGAGHATVAGACVTMLKAMFDAENFVISDPKQPNAAGDTLDNYVGDVLTAEGELNKIAYNVALGRNIAGVHWRTDASLELGEQVAIQLLRDHKKKYHPAELYRGFEFRKFDGTRVTI